MGSSLAYHTRARYIPAILASLPIQVLYYGAELARLDKLFLQISAFEIGKNSAISIAIVYLFALFCREIGKFAFESRYYSDGNDFPTTKLLTWNDDGLPTVQKHKVYAKILRDFDIQLAIGDEAINEPNESRKLIKAAISQVIGKVGDGRLTIERLIEYGFWRNLIGGSTIALPVSLFGAYVFVSSGTLYWAFIVFAMISACLITFARKILDRHGKNYATTLISEYLQV